MRLLAFLVAALSIVCAAVAVDVQKSVIITYPADTPNSVLDQAKQAIREGGGVITHEYQLIKGFAAKVGEKVLDTVTAWGKPYNALIEEDQLVSSL
ncbi:hypothetical protein QBC33DRAFT_554366 [Phialemonium atrogriseum]|uniref:Proteinase inhibitor, propeptide n=1 Tax=Phialemonium atrogriseum TaxID=1093897 RepID=A0AAJ0CEN5_9PEZI|nr:uncharacterized protein QBC33DRAFT_554366 [Phialemonium atrogriseum]KAK1772926.1 hypothetical protein QBC33DRAFT_554366 [Phialemonium atrogriseum]